MTDRAKGVATLFVRGRDLVGKGVATLLVRRSRMTLLTNSWASFGSRCIRIVFRHVSTWYSSQCKNSYFTEMCSGSEAGSYLRLIDFCITRL